MSKMRMMNCSYPECSEVFYISVEQKRELKTYNFLKYGTTSDVYCSKECQEKHMKELSEAEFLRKGTMKNREYALIVNGADVTKRIKEKEVHIITGKVTEQRARCLREKLSSVLPRNKARYLTSREVQEFLLKDVSANIKAPVDNIDVTAWRVMNKCRELFPNSVLIIRQNKKNRCLMLIE